MPTIVAHHDVKDTTHWLASPKREEFFGALGVTNIRTFTDPRNPGHVALQHGRPRSRGAERRDADAERLPPPWRTTA